MFLTSLIIMIVSFTSIFFYLIYSDKKRFNEKKRLIKLELVINLIISLTLLIINGLGITMYFILFWLILGFISYLFYNKDKKFGFIGTTFCTFFLIIFLILQIWIY